VGKRSVSFEIVHIGQNGGRDLFRCWGIFVERGLQALLNESKTVGFDWESHPVLIGISQRWTSPSLDAVPAALGDVSTLSFRPATDESLRPTLTERPNPLRIVISH
jgi:hypothetical protein